MIIQHNMPANNTSRMLNITVASQNTVGTNLANMDGAGGTLASAAASLSSGAGGTDLTYQLNIDTSDYDSSSYTTKKDELASTVAYEMMHTIMYDTLTTGMMGSDKFPKWFVEGAAQTMGGDFTAGHNSGLTSLSSSQMESYLSNFKSDVYGAGYIATMYLGAAVKAGQSATSITSVSNTDITAGLNKPSYIGSFLYRCSSNGFNSSE